METGKLWETVGAGPLDPAEDRVMICGSKEMIDDTAALCEKFGLEEGSNSDPKQFVIEKAFVG